MPCLLQLPINVRTVWEAKVAKVAMMVIMAKAAMEPIRLLLLYY